MSAASAWWIVGGLVVAAFESLAPGLALVWIGLAATLAGLATALFGLGLWAQAATFAIAAPLLAILAPRLRRTRRKPGPALVGQPCRALEFRDGRGRVTLADAAWPARATPPAQPRPGDALVVTGLDGGVLLVAPPG